MLENPEVLMSKTTPCGAIVKPSGLEPMLSLSYCGANRLQPLGRRRARQAVPALQARKFGEAGIDGTAFCENIGFGYRENTAHVIVSQAGDIGGVRRRAMRSRIRRSCASLITYLGRGPTHR